MNIDDLKDAWGKDEPKGTNLTTTIAFSKKSASPVARIRRNMKSEFIAVLVSYAFLIMLMFYGNQSAHYLNLTNPVINASILVVFILFILNGFYFARFYAFYHSFSRYDLNLRDSIRKIVYELELNVEIYKTYNFCVTPLAVLVTFMLLCGTNGMHYLQKVLSTSTFASPLNLLVIFLVIIISFAVTYICINYHIRTQYGKYITELKKIMDDLGDEG
ncbi:MAG: hypothetical protein ACHQIM_17405 [Sphingobacteriales bacterium]